MTQFEYKIKYAGTSTTDGDVIFNCKFFAPNKKVAESLKDVIGRAVSEHGLITPSKQYQHLLNEL